MTLVISTGSAKQGGNGLANVVRLLLGQLRESLSPASVIAKHRHPLPRRDRVEKGLGRFDAIDSQNRRSAATGRVQVGRQSYIARAGETVGHAQDMAIDT